MSIESFVPTVWSATMLKNLNNAHVFAKAFNRNYEGEVTMGGSVRINAIGRITISDYNKNNDLSAPELLQTADQTFVIDSGKTFHFYVDDLDKAQAKASVREDAMREAAWGMDDKVDVYLATKLANALPAANTLAAATIGNAATDTDAYATLVQLGVVLDDNNIPSDGRMVFCPNWFVGMLQLDPRFTSFGTGPNRDQLTRGMPAGTTVDGFTVYKSNNMPTSGGNPVVLATTTAQGTYAEQLDKMEAYRPQLRFGDAVKGLHVFGAKVLRPTAIAGIVATKGTY